MIPYHDHDIKAKTCWSTKKQKILFYAKLAINVTKITSNLRIIHPIPLGCLQYFVHDTGLLRSFNFPPAATVGATGLLATSTQHTSYTHLANQNYKICIQVWWLTNKGLSFCPLGQLKNKKKTFNSNLHHFRWKIEYRAIPPIRQG